MESAIEPDQDKSRTLGARRPSCTDTLTLVWVESFGSLALWPFDYLAPWLLRHLFGATGVGAQLGLRAPREAKLESNF